MTNAPYREISNLLHSVSSGMAELDLEVKEIVGVSQDVYRLWNLESYIPDLTDRLKENQEKLNQVFDRLEALTGRGRTDFNTLSAAYQDLEKDHRRYLPYYQQCGHPEQYLYCGIRMGDNGDESLPASRHRVH